MDFESFTTEKVLKRDERHEITVIYHADSGNRFIKHIIREDKRRIYKTLQKINHENIPKIMDVRFTDCTIVIEEYICGITLGELMEQRHQFPYKQIKSIADQLVSAIAELHKNQIIHRDIKPDNIMMDNQGKIWLIDYDIARIYSKELRRDTTVLGTVGYAPVEQFGMMPTDYKTDIYAFGATISQLLEYSHKKGFLYKIAQKCKRLDPAQRYQNIKQVKRALNRQFIRSVRICILLISVIIASVYIADISKRTENRYDEYIGTWRDDTGIILEMVDIEDDIAKFNIKAEQPDGSIRSIYDITGMINDDKIKFSTVITDFGDVADGTLMLENNCIYVDVFTENMNTSSSIRAAAIVTKDIQINVNREPVQLAENPPLVIDNHIFVPSGDFPRELKLDSYYDSGFWAGDSETRITVMNRDTIMFFSSYDGMNWNLYVTHDENIQSSYVYEYEQVPIISQQPAMINDTVYIPLEILTEQFGAEMTYDENKKTVNITADTSADCKSKTEIKNIESFDSEKAYDMAKLKYKNLTQTDGMPHYNHKGKFFMFLTDENTTVYVYNNGMIEIN